MFSFFINNFEILTKTKRKKFSISKEKNKELFYKFLIFECKCESFCFLDSPTVMNKRRLGIDGVVVL